MSDPSTSRFQILFEAALQCYEMQTGMNLADHPLARQLDNRHSVESIVEILEQQARPLTKYQKDDDKVMKSLKRVVHILHALSKSTEHIGLLFPPAKVLFAAFAILFTAINDVSACYDALVELFESIEHFLSCLDNYTKLPLTAAMETIVVKIMVEILSTVALVTKQIKESRPLKLIKKIRGDNDIEAVLHRLDRLTLDEARTTAVQTLELVYGLVQNMRVVMDDGEASADTIWDALENIQYITSKMNESEREKVQEATRRWLSPPDPWKNHNTARKAHYGETSRWFLQGNTFAKWKSSDQHQLLWIHGKPGAGKSVISSTIIEDIDDLRKRGLATSGFFYCDLVDDRKKKLRGLLSSLLLQLCYYSDPYSTILSDFYWYHGRGSRAPSDDALIGCLKRMLKHPGQAPIYIIVDGLDEFPNTFGMPSPREEVLMFLNELIELHLPNLHLCITSRPEVDITYSLDHLPFRTVSLHEESGQRQDIIDYISSVIYTDPNMTRWTVEDKELVIKVLTDKADGMFRWVFCQLEFLRRCLPAQIRQALEELPETLDGTYERTLQDIDNANWKLAHRIFQCVAVASRPLRVEELAEFLAFDFDTGPTPVYRADWRPLDPVGAVLSTCSTLLAIVKVEGAEVIQFSHFSVKEYLISTRLAGAKDTISRYHVSMTLAHTLVAQACLGILLHLNESTTSDNLKNFPLAEYAAQHWMDHARLEGMSATTQDGMRRLFDPRTPHFALWARMCPLRFPWASHLFQKSTYLSQPRGSSLDYAAFFGFHDLVTFLVVECSQDVNASGLDNNSTPLHVALEGRHVEFVRMLLDHGADVNAQNDDKLTPLYLALKNEHVELFQILLDHGADVTYQNDDKLTPLHLALESKHVGFARMLLEHGADVDGQDDDKSTPLHLAAEDGRFEFAHILLEHGADVDAQDDYKLTPLHLALDRGHVKVARVLLEQGADVSSRDFFGLTPLQRASKRGFEGMTQLLLEYGSVDQSVL